MTQKRLNRLTLTISDELKAALAELNAATGVAAASFVGEIIEENIPLIRGVAEAARRAKEEPGVALELMQRAMLEALHGVSSAQLELMDEQSKLRTYNRKDGEDAPQVQEQPKPAKKPRKAKAVTK